MNQAKIKQVAKKDLWFRMLMIFFALSCIVGYYRGFTGLFKHSYLLPQWYYYFNVVSNTVALAALYFFYKMQKIGVILFFTVLVTDFMVQLFFGRTLNTASLFFIFSTVTLIGVKVVPNWKKYD